MDFVFLFRIRYEQFADYHFSGGNYVWGASRLRWTINAER